jgi:methyl-accepting chemotaxis protein
MVQALRELVRQIRDASDAMSVSASQFDKTAAELNRSSGNQHATAAETARIVEEMTHSIDQVAQSAQAAVEVSGQANETAKTGQRVVVDAAKEMARIAESVSDSAKNVAALGQRSHEISNIVEVIKAVADQTNLLALNAAIEAARAGEQGRGFAVVADEVRSLAQRTTTATAEISRTIEAIQSETRNAVAAMEAGNSRVRTGVDLANSGASALDAILTGMDKSLLSINEIATATEEQSSATHEIAGQVENIARVSEKSAHDTGQLVDAARQLQSLSKSLQQNVGRFEI